MFKMALAALQGIMMQDCFKVLHTGSTNLLLTFYKKLKYIIILNLNVGRPYKAQCLAHFLIKAYDDLSIYNMYQLKQIN